MKTYEVRITMPDTIEEGRKLFNDLLEYEGQGSVKYLTWRRLYEADNSKYHGGFEISFTFYDENNAHSFNNIWDKDINNG